MCARADIEPKKGDKKMEKRLSPGDEVECVMKMPRGGMGAYLIKKSVVALRAADAYLILVGEVEP